MNGKHTNGLPALELYSNGKSSNWILHEELFGAQLQAEPWSPSQDYFDRLIDEQNCFEISLRKERRKTEELKKENSQLKKDIKTLKNSNMKLDGDLRAAINEHGKALIEKDEIIGELESKNKLLEKEVAELKSSCVKFTTSEVEAKPSTEFTYQEINNNNLSPTTVSQEPTVTLRVKKPKRLSNVSLLVQQFESTQIQASEKNEVKRPPARRKTVHSFYSSAS